MTNNRFFLILILSFLVFLTYSCEASTEKDSLKIDFKSEEAVTNYIKMTDLCQRITFIRNNLALFVQEEELGNYAYLITRSVSCETKEGIVILAFNHQGQPVSEESRKNFLNDQMIKFYSTFCQKKE